MVIANGTENLPTATMPRIENTTQLFIFREEGIRLNIGDQGYKVATAIAIGEIFPELRF